MLESVGNECWSPQPWYRHASCGPESHPLLSHLDQTPMHSTITSPPRACAIRARFWRPEPYPIRCGEVAIGQIHPHLALQNVEAPIAYVLEQQQLRTISAGVFDRPRVALYSCASLCFKPGRSFFVFQQLVGFVIHGSKAPEILPRCLPQLACPCLRRVMPFCAPH